MKEKTPRMAIHSDGTVVFEFVKLGTEDKISDTTSEIQIKYIKQPSSSFELAAYGLPEPPGFEPPSTPLYLWLLLAAGICAILAIGFRLLARRKSA